MTYRETLAACIAAVSLVSAGAASAADDVMIVRMGDLNVHSAQGAEVALRRIKSAAGEFCSPDNRSLGIARHERRSTCIKKMTGKAVAALDAPRVTAIYEPAPAMQLAQVDAGSR